MPFKDKDTSRRYHKGYWKEYYSDPIRKARHKKAVRLSEARRKLRIKTWLHEYKISSGCRECGFNKHPAALDFAHKDRSTKLHNVSNMSRLGWSLKKIQDEIDKCIVLCANCHRIETCKENLGC